MQPGGALESFSLVCTIESGHGWICLIYKAVIKMQSNISKKQPNLL